MKDGNPEKSAPRRATLLIGGEKRLERRVRLIIYVSLIVQDSENAK